MAVLKKQRPLIRYAGSAAETSIGSKPIGSELGQALYCERRRCQASLASACRGHLLAFRQTSGSEAGGIAATLCSIKILGLAHAGCLSQAGTPNTAAHHAVAGMLRDHYRWLQ